MSPAGLEITIPVFSRSKTLLRSALDRTATGIDVCYYHHHRRRRRLPGLGLMACSDSEFNFSEFMNLWTIGRTPWTGDRPDGRPLPTQDNTTQKDADTSVS
jgi:hypothetical protein